MGDPAQVFAMEEGPCTFHFDVPPRDIDPEFKGWAPPHEYVPFPGRRIVAPRRGGMGLLPMPHTNASEIRALHGMLDNMRRRVEEEAVIARNKIGALEHQLGATQATVSMMEAQIISLREEMEQILRRLDPGADAMVEKVSKAIDSLKNRK